MNINNITISGGEGFVYPKSAYYSSCGILTKSNCIKLNEGINNLIGEIDCGNWEISYLLSMYKYRPKDFVLSEIPTILLNNKTVSLDEISRIACYMDESYHLFSSKKTVKEQIKHNLKRSKVEYGWSEIVEYFELDDERIERTIKQVGNERFRAMAAIGISCGKELFCFPWLSNSRFLAYHNNMTVCLDKLAKLEKTVVLPIGNA